MCWAWRWARGIISFHQTSQRPSDLACLKLPVPPSKIFECKLQHDWDNCGSSNNWKWNWKGLNSFRLHYTAQLWKRFCMCLCSLAFGCCVYMQFSMNLVVFLRQYRSNTVFSFRNAFHIYANFTYTKMSKETSRRAALNASWFKPAHCAMPLTQYRHVCLERLLGKCISESACEEEHLCKVTRKWKRCARRWICPSFCFHNVAESEEHCTVIRKQRLALWPKAMSNSLWGIGLGFSHFCHLCVKTQ